MWEDKKGRGVPQESKVSRWDFQGFLPALTFHTPIVHTCVPNWQNQHGLRTLGYTLYPSPIQEAPGVAP